MTLLAPSHVGADNSASRNSICDCSPFVAIVKSLRSAESAGDLTAYPCRLRKKQGHSSCSGLNVLCRPAPRPRHAGPHCSVFFQTSAVWEHSSEGPHPYPAGWTALVSRNTQTHTYSDDPSIFWKPRQQSWLIVPKSCQINQLPCVLAYLPLLNSLRGKGSREPLSTFSTSLDGKAEPQRDHRPEM